MADKSSASKGRSKTNRAEKPARPVKAKAAEGAKSRPAARDASGRGASSMWESATQFMREVKTELKKVTWPSRRQTLSSTGVVVALVFIVSVFLGLVDMVLARLVRLVIG